MASIVIMLQHIGECPYTEKQLDIDVTSDSWQNLRRWGFISQKRLPTRTHTIIVTIQSVDSLIYNT